MIVVHPLVLLITFGGTWATATPCGSRNAQCAGSLQVRSMTAECQTLTALTLGAIIPSRTAPVDAFGSWPNCCPTGKLYRSAIYQVKRNRG